MKKGLILNESEIISSLKRTSIPTVLVEGKDEAAVYRWLESKINIDDIDILTCSGRETLFRVYKRRNEFMPATVAFIADRDMWLFTGIPEEFHSEIIFTSGYSLENDLYVRELFEGLLSKEEKGHFDALISELCTWFAHEVDRFKTNNASLCDFHINQICPDRELCDDFKRSIGFIEPRLEDANQILERYSEALRGKNLFQALLRFLSASKRGSKFSRMNLIELGAKSENPLVHRLIEDIRKAIEGQQDSGGNGYRRATL